MELDLQEQKGRLLEKKQELERSMAGLPAAHPEPGDVLTANEGDNDLEDRAVDANEMEDEKLIFLNEQALLNQVHSALQRLADGTYGLCQVCGKQIEAKRLEALPWAEHCISCESRREREQAEV